MRLEPTANRAKQIDRSPTGRREGILVTVACAVLLILLAGCAEGTSRDAEQGKKDDAARTSVVSDMQATRTSELLKSTPPATSAPEE